MTITFSRAILITREMVELIVVISSSHHQVIQGQEVNQVYKISFSVFSSKGTR